MADLHTGSQWYVGVVLGGQDVELLIKKQTAVFANDCNRFMLNISCNYSQQSITVVQPAVCERLHKSPSHSESKVQQASSRICECVHVYVTRGVVDAIGLVVSTDCAIKRSIVRRIF